MWYQLRWPNKRDVGVKAYKFLLWNLNEQNISLGETCLGLEAFLSW